MSYEFRRGFITALPIMLGFMPLGLILGAQASQVGQSALTTFLMSGINFAGGSEFAALGLWSATPPILIIAFTTFLINSRHIVMGVTFAPYMRHERGLRLYMGHFCMVDESWALTMQDIQKRSLEGKGFSYWFHIGAGVGLWMAWAFSSLAGSILGNSFGNLSGYGFLAAMPATFIALAVAMRPKPIIGINRLLTYAPVVASFIGAGLTSVYGNPHYCVGIGIFCGLLTAFFVQVYKEKKGLIKPQDETGANAQTKNQAHDQAHAPDQEEAMAKNADNSATNALDPAPAPANACATVMAAAPALVPATAIATATALTDANAPAQYSKDQ